MPRRRTAAASGWEHVAWVDSESEPGDKWEVKRHVATGRYGCGCPRYRFNRSGNKTCKHIMAALAPADVRSTFNREANSFTALVAGERFVVQQRRAISLGGMPDMAAVGVAVDQKTVTPAQDLRRRVLAGLRDRLTTVALAQLSGADVGRMREHIVRHVEAAWDTAEGK